MEFPVSFGKYELLERIAVGGMAEVFLARATGAAGFEKMLVIKRILPELELDPRFVQMFIAEANIAVQLNHPNIVQVFDLDRVRASWYIAMEHLHGMDLTRWMKALRGRGERIDLAVAVRMMADALRGLDYAHSRVDAQGKSLGLVHRDVSPHNIVVTFTGEVKLVDFGIARLTNGDAPAGEESPRGGAGKFAYMAPEQVQGEGDHRVDVFSAGIVLWEMLANRRLYSHPDQEEKLRMVREAAIPELAEDLAALSAPAAVALRGILARALAQRPADRYSTAGHFEEELRAWLHRYGYLVDRARISAELSRAFPEQSVARTRGFDVSRLLADVSRLDPEPDAVTPSEPSGPLAGSHGERKTVVVLALDLFGLTELSARLEPDVFVRRRIAVLRWLHEIGERYGAKLLQYQDEQVLLFFGVPKNQVDDAERAVACALELHEATSTLRARGLSLHLTIGAHVGEVTVGPVEPNLRYLSRGDTTRLARRLANTAEFGQVLVSQRLLPLIERRFRVVRGPDLQGRGTSLPVATYWARGRRGSWAGTEQGAWIRRNNELDVVREALTPLSQGEGSALLVVGGTGVGKSRLIHEIVGLARRRNMSTYVTRCAVWGEDVPLEPLRDLVRQVLGLRQKADPMDVEERLGRLYNLGIPEDSRRVLAALLGETPPEAGSVWRAVQRLLHGIAEERPIIVAMDDVHRLGGNEHRHLRRMIEDSAHVPLLFLLSWKGTPAPLLASGLTQVVLEAFEPAAQGRLVRSLLRVEDVDREICALVERTCEGNPLYIEEMLKFLVQEEKVQVRDGAAKTGAAFAGTSLPRNLAAVFAARVDALDAAAKGTLQLAALVGTDFSAALVGAAAGLDDPVPLMSALASHGLIRRVGGADPDAWTFSSELVREAALRGILGVQRRDFHRLIAATMEDQGRNGGANAWALAEHCAGCGRMLDAAKYAFHAGKALEEGQFLVEAQDVYQKGITWMNKAEADSADRDLRMQGMAMLHHRYGAVSLLKSEIGKGERSLFLALDIASESNFTWIEADVHLELGKSYLHRRQFSLAVAHLEQAKELAKVDPDPVLELEVRETMAMVALETYDSRAEALWDEARSFAATQGPLAEARCMTGLSVAKRRAGDGGALALLLDALPTARTAGDRILEGKILNNMGLLYAEREEFEEASGCFRAALAAREGVGYARGGVVNHHNMGDVYLEQGEFDKAYVAFQRSKELASELGWERPLLLNDLYLDFLDAWVGGRQAEERLHEGVDALALLADHEGVIVGHELMGRLYAQRGQWVEAKAAFDEAERIAVEEQLVSAARHVRRWRARLVEAQTGP